MNDQKRIQGTWRVVSGERHGTPFSEEATKNVQLVFSGDTLTTKTRNGDNRVTFKLNPEKSPREIDVDMDGQPGLGIYALEGDDLRILHGEVGDPRPTGFDTQDRSRLTLLVLRRE